MTRRVPRRVRQATAHVGRHLPLVVLALSVTVNVLLAHRLLGAAAPAARGLEVGSVVEPFAGVAVGGIPITIEYPNTLPTVLYYFSPACSWCERNWANIRALVAETKGRYRFLGVSPVAVTPDFMRQHQLDFETATGISPEVAKQYAFGGTPQTMVISADRRVLHIWSGAYTGLQRQEVEGYFGIQLPGLGPASPPTHRP
jgi:peroxiredoxin